MFHPGVMSGTDEYVQAARDRMQASGERYRAARDAYNQTLAALNHGKHVAPEGVESLRCARLLESQALVEYQAALRAFADLILGPPGV